MQCLRTFKQAEKLLKEVSTAKISIERHLLPWSDIQQVSPESYRDTNNGTIEFMLKENQAWPSNMEAFKKIGNLPLMSLMMKITCWGIFQIIVQVLLTQVMIKVKNSQTRRKPTQILLRFSEIQSRVWGIVQYCWWQFSSQECKWSRKALKQRPEV